MTTFGFGGGTGAGLGGRVARDVLTAGAAGAAEAGRPVGAVPPQAATVSAAASPAAQRAPPARVTVSGHVIVSPSPVCLSHSDRTRAGMCCTPGCPPRS